jgi:trimethylamine:corrinoid methyltransferase-like protein
MEKVRWILENHEPEPLAPDVLAGIRAIVTETEKELGIGG